VIGCVRTWSAGTRARLVWRGRRRRDLVLEGRPARARDAAAGDHREGAFRWFRRGQRRPDPAKLLGHHTRPGAARGLQPDNFVDGPLLEAIAQRRIPLPSRSSTRRAEDTVKHAADRRPNAGRGRAPDGVAEPDVCVIATMNPTTTSARRGSRTSVHDRVGAGWRSATRTPSRAGIVGCGRRCRTLTHVYRRLVDDAVALTGHREHEGHRQAAACAGPSTSP